MIKFNFNLPVGDDGLWLGKSHPSTIQCTHLKLPYISDDKRHSELRVYFDTSSWNTNKCGDVYTDTTFLKHLKEQLVQFGFSVESVSRSADRSNYLGYSEHGMQGDDFVSLDAGGLFIKEYENTHKSTNN